MKNITFVASLRKKLQAQFAAVQSLTDVFIVGVHACLFNKACDSFHDIQEQENKHPKHILANVISCREMGRGQLEVDTTEENKYHQMKLERSLHRKHKSIEMGKTED